MVFKLFDSDSATQEYDNDLSKQQTMTRKKKTKATI